MSQKITVHILIYTIWVSSLSSYTDYLMHHSKWKRLDCGPFSFTAHTSFFQIFYLCKCDFEDNCFLKGPAEAHENQHMKHKKVAHEYVAWLPPGW